MTRADEWRDETSVTLAARLFATRAHSQELTAHLSAEDQCVQAMPDASPTKWHLAHTTWFFERFVLEAHVPDYRVFDPHFGFCFNSYYETQGARQPRAQRGLLTRPSADEVRAYRAHVDKNLHRLFERPLAQQEQIAQVLDIGIHHEQQHQELILTDILALFAANPLHPAWREEAPVAQPQAAPLSFSTFDGGIFEIGHAGHGFAFDNESPRHQILLRPFRLANRLVTNGEWLAFIDDGGYRNPLLWLADGWARVQAEDWHAPLYWQQCEGAWQHMTLQGLQAIDPNEPVCHISYFEADAFARWAGRRLPLEGEWEVAAAGLAGNDPAAGTSGPSARAGAELAHMFGARWQWTQSAYLPYPGYRAPQGAIGEYNGKFMVSQQVLRGSSFATPPGHARISYRNFFYPWQRWQFAGLRLAEDA